MKITHEGVEITATNFTPEIEELQNYVHFVKERVPDVDRIKVTRDDNDEVDISYVAHGQPFERIRRITGYLVGTIDRWNDAKQAEEKDRANTSQNFQLVAINLPPISERAAMITTKFI